jgi:hypothetical protein
MRQSSAPARANTQREKREAFSFVHYKKNTNHWSKLLRFREISKFKMKNGCEAERSNGK